MGSGWSESEALVDGEVGTVTLGDLTGSPLKRWPHRTGAGRACQSRGPRDPVGYTPGVPIDVDALVMSNDRLSATYNVLELAAPEVAAAARPGQFVMVKQNLAAAPLLRRPFSVFEVLRDERGDPVGLSILNKRIGIVTDALYALEPGQRLRCLGPLGRAFSLSSPPGEAWMVAGGVGLAPFATLAEALRAAQVPATLFYGGRSSEDLVYEDWFRQRGVRVRLTTEDGSRGESGLVTGPLEQALGTAATPPTIYACGPTPMMRAVAALAHEHGSPSEVSLEPVMGCGLGGCYSCVVRIRGGRLVRSCLHGPVFAGDRIDWDALAGAA